MQLMGLVDPILWLIKQRVESKKQTKTKKNVMGKGWAFLQISNQNALLGPILPPNPVCSERKKEEDHSRWLKIFFSF